MIEGQLCKIVHRRGRINGPDEVAELLVVVTYSDRFRFEWITVEMISGYNMTDIPRTGGCSNDVPHSPQGIAIKEQRLLALSKTRFTTRTAAIYAKDGLGVECRIVKDSIGRCEWMCVIDSSITAQADQE